MFENIRQDLRAHAGNWGAQGFWALVVYRFGRWRYGVRPSLVRKFFSLVYRILFKYIQIVTGIELPCEVQLGRNFVIDHFGGIAVGVPATIKPRRRLLQTVPADAKQLRPGDS